MNRPIRFAAGLLCVWLTLFSLISAAAGAADVPMQELEKVEVQARYVAPLPGPPEPPSPHRPRIGLVLGGGGARGLAHIGVLKVLEENHIPIDCIVGTSIGALVGGGYAAGQTADSMSQEADKTDWDQLFSAGLPRKQMSYRAKQDDSMHLAPIDLGVRDDLSLALPKSAMDTQKIEVLLRSLTYAGTARDFNSLAVPFRALATDLETGEMVVMGDGDLVTAMRASMAVPGVFPPVPRSDKLLVDGGLSRNLGVDVARKMCADVVIAVDVAMPPLKRDGIQTIFNVADQYTRLMILQNERPQIDSLAPGDVLISPPLGNIESMAFNRAKDLITLGEKGARQQLAELQRYALPEAGYKAWEAEREARKLHPKPIDSIEVARLSRVNPDVLSRNVEVETGKRFQGDNFNQQLSRLYARGDFSQLDYELLDNGAGQKLRLVPVEKDWGPNYLNFGIALGTDFDDSSPYALLMRYRRTWMNALGGELDVSLRAGDTMALSSEFYQPLQIDGYAFLAPNVSIQSSPLAGYKDGDQVAQYRYHKETFGMDLGSSFSRYGEARIGVMSEYYRLTKQIGPDIFGLNDEEFRQHDYGVHASISFDQLDHADFPSSGGQMRLSAYQAVGGDDEGDNYGKAEFSGRQAFSFGRTSGYVMAKGRISHNVQNNSADLEWMGGFMNMSSYAYQSLVGQNYLYGRVSLYRPMPFLQTDNKTAWLGFAAEVGQMRDVKDTSQVGTHYSEVGFVGVDTFLGPLYLGAAYGDNHQMRYYLTLGNPF